MEQIKEVVNDVINKLASKTGADQQRIVQAWQEAVGRKFGKHTSIRGIRDKKLIVMVDSPALMFHLNLKRNQILKALRRVEKDLDNITLKIGKVQ